MNTARPLTLLALAALVACEPVATKYVPPRWNTATIEVTWLKDDEAVTRRCTELGLQGAVNGCARSRPDNVQICEIYAVQPSDFNDSKRLEVLGHEVAHCLGARHD